MSSRIISNKIILASNNSGKIKEFNYLFEKFKLGVEIVAQSTLNVPECDEPFDTFIENAIHKARHCSKYTGLPAIADDSGLCVPVLGGEPGVYSARYAGVHHDSTQNINKLLDKMQGLTERKAYFYCTLVFMVHANDPQPIIADGAVFGEIAHEPLGLLGFGYNPIFYVPEYKLTFAQMSDDVRHNINHRAIALNKLITQLKEYYL